MGRLFIIKEVKTPADIRGELADPTRHWRAGYSAYELANAWIANPDKLPASVQDLFDKYPPFSDAELVEALFERKVEIGTPGRPSQNDVLAYCTTPRTSFVVAVEGKIKEPFGPYVRDRAPDISKDARLLSLCEQLGLSPTDAPPLRYQLMHRAVSALREALRYHATHAVLLVHSFDPGASSLEDYQRFAEALGLPGCEAAPGRICGPVRIHGIHFHLAWVTDSPMVYSPPASSDDAGGNSRTSKKGEAHIAVSRSSAQTLPSGSEPLSEKDDIAVPDNAIKRSAVAGFSPTIRSLIMRIKSSPSPHLAKPTNSISSNVSSGFKKRTGGEDYTKYYDLNLRRAVAELGALGGAPVPLLAELVVALKDEPDDQKWNVIDACRLNT